MKVRVIVKDKCTKSELDSLLTDSADVLKFKYTLLPDGMYDVVCDFASKCSLPRFIALKGYAKTKKGKVLVERVK